MTKVRGLKEVSLPESGCLDELSAERPDGIQKGPLAYGVSALQLHSVDILHQYPDRGVAEIGNGIARHRRMFPPALW